MIDSKHYVPILKCKRGEFGALSELAQAVKVNLTPLFEVLPLSDEDSIDIHLAKLIDNIAMSWINLDRPVFLDLENIDDVLRMSNGSHFLTYLFDDARKKGLKLIPVTNLVHDVDFQTEISRINSIDKLGVCLRFEQNDVFDPNFATLVDDLMQILKVTPNNCDLVIDFGSIYNSSVQQFSFLITSMLSLIPYLNDWRSFSVAATSFPINLSSIASNSSATITRLEWQTWHSLYNTRKTLKRLPTFSDYAISHPDIVEFDYRYMTLGSSLRYSYYDYWLVVKGVSIKRAGWTQMRGICQSLLSRMEFCGQTHCWGDNYIHECANGNVGPGNASTWRKVGNNHHMSLVISQISTLVWP